MKAMNCSMLWNPFSITSLLPVRSYADGTQAAGIIPFLPSMWQFYAAAFADSF